MNDMLIIWSISVRRAMSSERWKCVRLSHDQCGPDTFIHLIFFFISEIINRKSNVEKTICLCGFSCWSKQKEFNFLCELSKYRNFISFHLSKHKGLLRSYLYFVIFDFLIIEQLFLICVYFGNQRRVNDNRKRQQLIIN